MRKSHFNNEFLVLFGPIISRFSACSIEPKNKPKQKRVIALVLSLCLDPMSVVGNPLLVQIIEIGLEHTPFVVLAYFFLI
jgi:hypothetical protein